MEDVEFGTILQAKHDYEYDQDRKDGTKRSVFIFYFKIYFSFISVFKFYPHCFSILFWTNEFQSPIKTFLIVFILLCLFSIFHSQI